MQQDAGGNDDEVGFAIGGIAGVVEDRQGQARGRLGQGHDGAHAVVDGDRVGTGLVHQAFEDLGQDEGVADGLRIDLDLDATFLHHRIGHAGTIFDQRLFLAGLLDQFAEGRVVHGLDIHLPGGLADLGGLLATRTPAGGAADGDDPFAEGVLEAKQCPHTPLEFVVAVDDDILIVHAGLAVLIDGLAEVAVMGDFVPEIDRAGFVAKEQQRPFGGIGEGLEDADIGVGPIDQHQVVVGLAQFGGLVAVTEGNQRANLHRKFAVGL